MEILSLGSALKIKGKQTTLLIDPKDAKTASDIVILLKEQFRKDMLQIEGQRLIVTGSGEYEVGGAKISGIQSGLDMAYILRLDNLDILLAKGNILPKIKDRVKDIAIAVLCVDAEVAESSIPSLESRVVVLYGNLAKDVAKTLGKETIQQVTKYQTTAEKLPAEMEVVVLG